MSEEWRLIPSHAGYEASSLGRVRNKKTGHILRDRELGKGYRCAKLGAGQPKLIHRMVCEAFHGPCPEGMWCAHLNGNPQDNRPENLKWATPKENHAHKVDHGTVLRGETAPWSVLNDRSVKEIRRLAKAGNTQREIAIKFGVSQSLISNIVTQKYWRHV